MNPLDLDSVWQVAELQRSPDGTGRAHGAGVFTLAGEILLAVDEDGSRAVLFPTTDDDAFAPDVSTKVHLSRRVLRVDSKKQTYVAVTCQVSRLNPVFNTLAMDMIQAAEGEVHPGAAVRRILNEWRDLLSGERRGLLTDNEVVGLFAELSVLTEVLARDPSRDITIWKGPEDATHDIRRGDHSFEVKATTNREGLAVEIHGVKQLEAPSGGTLHLVVYRLEVDPQQGSSIPDLVRGIIELGVDSHEFTSRLKDYGYDPADEEKYETKRYSLVERRFYAVDEEFPRIIPKSFVGGNEPASVILIRYTVELTGAVPEKLTAEKTDAALNLLATGE